MNKSEVIAYHGWGFDASFWRGWRKYMPASFELFPFERGYFTGEMKSPVFSRQKQAGIVLAHSFGLHLCSRENLQNADLIVIFGGFIHFHPAAAQFKRRSQKVLSQMITRFESEPRQVLKQFYRNVFHPQKPWSLPEGGLNVELLLNDLKTLKSAVLDIGSLKNAGKISILHGFDDGIVPKRKGRQLYSELHPQSKYLEVKNGGHALPFTHSEQCWSFLKPEFKELTSGLNE